MKISLLCCAKLFSSNQFRVKFYSKIADLTKFLRQDLGSKIPQLSKCGKTRKLLSLENEKFKNDHFIFQSLMGVFFYTHSVALIEDIGLEPTYTSETELITSMNAGYEQVPN